MELPCMQVRVWVPAAVMRRAQATMVQGTGPGSSGLTLTVLSDFQESSVPLQVSPARPSAWHLTQGSPSCSGPFRALPVSRLGRDSEPAPDKQTGPLRILASFSQCCGSKSVLCGGDSEVRIC